MHLIRWIQQAFIATLIIGAGAAVLYSNDQDSQGGLIVQAIESGELADLVVVSGGLQQGLERGMLLSVFRDGRKTGEILITRTESNCSAALITEISPNESLSIGDRATPKVRKL